MSIPYTSHNHPRSKDFAFRLFFRQSVRVGRKHLIWECTDSSFRKQIVDCKLAGTTQAVCTGTASGSGVSTGTTTATLRGDNLPTAIAVEVTAGAEKTKNIKTSSSSTSGSSTSSEATSGTSAEASTTATEQPSSTSAAPAATTSDASALFEPALGLVIAMLLAVVAATFM